MSGDVVFIPPITKKVGILGAVERPGIYELIEGETAQDLIQYAGTTKPGANLNSIDIKRIDPKGNGFNLLDVSTETTPFSEISLNNGDTLSIQSVISKLNQAILISGHATKTGYYPWKKGMKVSDIIKSKDDLLPMTDLNYLLIKREVENTQLYQTLQINFKVVFCHCKAFGAPYSCSPLISRFRANHLLRLGMGPLRKC